MIDHPWAWRHRAWCRCPYGRASPLCIKEMQPVSGKDGYGPGPDRRDATCGETQRCGTRALQTSAAQHQQANAHQAARVLHRYRHRGSCCPFQLSSIKLLRSITHRGIAYPALIRSSSIYRATDRGPRAPPLIMRCMLRCSARLAAGLGSNLDPPHFATHSVSPPEKAGKWTRSRWIGSLR